MRHEKRELFSQWYWETNLLISERNLEDHFMSKDSKQNNYLGTESKIINLINVLEWQKSNKHMVKKLKTG